MGPGCWRFILVLKFCLADISPLNRKKSGSQDGLLLNEILALTSVSFSSYHCYS